MYVFALGIVYAFNVGLTPGADRKSRSARIDIRQHNIIYKMIDDLREELFKRLPPLKEENIIGEPFFEKKCCN